MIAPKPQFLLLSTSNSKTSKREFLINASEISSVESCGGDYVNIIMKNKTTLDGVDITLSELAIMLSNDVSYIVR
ncbi:MAG: hypothetical protein IKR19_07945 [Acholeplasmatales bacterium]|nr:hypothetical protein [Acholeplasmatales bacterium]